jgi:D-amino peptidase
MNVFISADIEGVAGICSPSETNKADPDYQEFRELMTAEVVAACEAALEAGATKVLVKDAHASARNIIVSALPESVEIIRGWSGHPTSMMQGVDQGMDRAIMLGYHSAASQQGNPLSHTMSGRTVHRLTVNGQVWSEFHINSMTGLYYGCPTVLVSGDTALARVVKAYDPAIETVEAFAGTGLSVQSLSPKKVQAEIRAGVTQALQRPLDDFRAGLPEHFRLQLEYKHHSMAYERGFYPGAQQINDNTVQFECDDYFDALRFMKFCI